jgi:hypothetical protein
MFFGRFLDQCDQFSSGYAVNLPIRHIPHSLPLGFSPYDPSPMRRTARPVDALELTGWQLGWGLRANRNAPKLGRYSAKAKAAARFVKAIVGGGSIGNPGGSFRPAKITDLNSDGKSDMLFRDARGTYASWLLDDTAIIGDGNLGNLGAGWVQI